jgi:hypothetical protein
MKTLVGRVVKPPARRLFPYTVSAPLVTFINRVEQRPITMKTAGEHGSHQGVTLQRIRDTITGELLDLIAGVEAISSA